jgi:hypothetical protein
MKFRSITDEDIHIALTSGHTTIVTPEGNDIDKMFAKEAIARGCLPEGVSDEDVKVSGGFDRAKVIADVLNGMLDGGDEKDFTSHGKPDLKRLNSLLGFQISRAEADAAWENVTKA